MTNEQCNALTAAIITGFNVLARATAWGGKSSRRPQTGNYLMFDAKPDCCALPIEPPAPVEAEVVDSDGWYYLKPDDVIQNGDYCAGYKDSRQQGKWASANPFAGTQCGAWRAMQFRRKIDGGA